jgi:hypothetical protein
MSRPLSLEDCVRLDYKEYPLFGGKPIKLLDYILFDTNTRYCKEEDRSIQQGIACSRGGVVRLNYNQFPTPVKEEMRYIFEGLPNRHKKGSPEWIKLQEHKLYYTPIIFCQQR